MGGSRAGLSPHAAVRSRKTGHSWRQRRRRARTSRIPPPQCRPAVVQVCRVSHARARLHILPLALLFRRRCFYSSINVTMDTPVAGQLRRFEDRLRRTVLAERLCHFSRPRDANSFMVFGRLRRAATTELESFMRVVLAATANEAQGRQRTSRVQSLGLPTSTPEPGRLFGCLRRTCTG